MNVALRELRRRPGRFAPATVILVLIAVLLLFLGGLASGLNANNDGVIRTQRGDLLVFSSTAEDQIPQSIVTGEQRGAIEAVPGVERTGELSIQQLGARLGGRDDRDLVDTVVVGFELPIQGAARPPRAGTGLADATLRDEGIERGDTVRIGPARSKIRVVGYVDRAGFQGQGSLWVSPETFGTIVEENAPGEALPPGTAQVLAVDAEGSADDDTAARIARRVDGVTALTVAGAADAIPVIGGGVIQAIVYVTIAIAFVVVALFFALLTAERMPLYGVLKAIGARNRTLAGGLVVQATIVAAVASAVALVAVAAGSALFASIGVPFEFRASRAAIELALLLAASILGASISLRRVARLDPAFVIGGAP